MKRVHSKWPRQTVQAFVISPHNGPPPVLALSTYIFLEENTTKLGGETSSYDGILLKCVLTSVSHHLFFEANAPTRLYKHWRILSDIWRSGKHVGLFWARKCYGRRKQILCEVIRIGKGHINPVIDTGLNRGWSVSTVPKKVVPQTQSQTDKRKIIKLALLKNKCMSYYFKKKKVWRWIILFADSLKCQRGLFCAFWDKLQILEECFHVLST